MHRCQTISTPVSRLILGVIFAVSATLSQAEPQMLDRVVVIVDKSVIMQSELDARLQEIASRAQQAKMRLPPRDVLQNQVLDQLISETLQLNMADMYGIEIPDAEVNGALETVKANQGWSTEQLAVELAKDGSSIHEFQAKVRRDLKIRNVSQGVVRGRIRISEQEISNFLQSAAAQFWISPEYHLGHILIALPPSPTKAQSTAAEEKADRLYKQLKKGASFEELAIAESSGPSALSGGDLGFRKSSDLPTLFAEIAPKLEIGEVAKPARSQAGFHILKLHSKRGETKQIVAQARVRHILIKPSTILNKEKALEKIQGFRTKIVNGEAEFKDLAKDHSEDIGSKLQGGEMDWADPNQFVPEFAQKVNEGKIGEVSEPFFTQFGWHILEVLERRQEDFTKEAIRMKARQVLTSRRFEDETQVWLQEMRDEAFIEKKI